MARRGAPTRAAGRGRRPVGRRGLSRPTAHRRSRPSLPGLRDVGERAHRVRRPNAASRVVLASPRADGTSGGSPRRVQPPRARRRPSTPSRRSRRLRGYRWRARVALEAGVEQARRVGQRVLANVSFTTSLYVSPVQIIPACDQTGTPRHFHSSTTSGSACLMSVRTRASARRQSPNSSIRASISREGESPSLASFAPLLPFCSLVVVAFFMVVAARRVTGRSLVVRPRRPSGVLARQHGLKAVEVLLIGVLNERAHLCSHLRALELLLPRQVRLRAVRLVAAWRQRHR